MVFATVVGRWQSARNKFEQILLVIAVGVVHQDLFMVLLHGNAVIVDQMLRQVDIADEGKVSPEADANRAAHVERDVQVFQREVIVQRRYAQLLTIAIRAAEYVDLRVFDDIRLGAVLAQEEFIRHQRLLRMVRVAVCRTVAEFAGIGAQ